MKFNYRKFFLSSTLTLFFVLTGLAAYAQNPCALPSVSLKPKGPTIFTPEQEGYLGDLALEQLRLGNMIYPRLELEEPLDRIAARLLKYLPQNEYRFQFSLMALPAPNAFSFPGGRVLVSTSLITLAESEDELASVLAHEMGHILARQASADITKAFKDVLSVTSISDREDIFQKLNQLLDRANRRSGSVGKEEDDQTVADQVSAEAVWRAGYDPQAGPRFFDRLTENKGDTGGFFSDLFGVTSPEAKRFRDMIKTVSAIPASCRETKRALNDGEFKEWQQKIAALTLNDLASSTVKRTPTRVLTPRVRPQITNLRFSPDGKLILAQDESSIDIVSREPLRPLFRIPALGAGRAMFHKDSNRVLFLSSTGRLESWNLETRASERAWQPSRKHACGVMTVSPDGRVVACMNNPYAREIRLIDVQSDTEIARHNFNIDALLSNRLRASGIRPVHVSFSANGAVFLGAAYLGEPPWAFDVNKRVAIPIPSPLKNALSSSFAFIGTDRIATAHPQDARESGLYSWPDGKAIAKFVIPKSSIEAATNGAAIVVRPVKEYAAGVMNVTNGEVFQVSAGTAIDRYGDTSVSERTGGEIGIYANGQTQVTATLLLPDSDLFEIRAATHSPDLQWFALSVKDRGIYWNLRTGEALTSGAFDVPYISADNVSSAYLEQVEGQKKVTYRTSVDLERRQALSSTKLSADDPDRKMFFKGKYAIDILLPKARDSKLALQVKDATTSKVLWTRDIEGMPDPYLGNAFVWLYDVQDNVADRLIKENPEMKRVLDSTRNRNELSLLEVLSLETGEVLGRVLIHDGGLPIRSITVAGRTLYVEDTSNRTLAYSLDSGARTGQLFGKVVAVDPIRGLAAIQNQPGAISVVNGSMRSLAAFEFPRNVIYAGFEGTGKRLLVFSGAQEVFIENIPE